MKQSSPPGIILSLVFLFAAMAGTDLILAQGSFGGSHSAMTSRGDYGSVRQSGYNSRNYSSAGYRTSGYSTTGMRSSGYSTAGMRSSGYSARGISRSTFDSEPYGSVRQAVRYTPGGLPLGDPPIESGVASDDGQAEPNIQIVKSTAMAEPDSGGQPEDEPESSQEAMPDYNGPKIIKQMPAATAEPVGGAVRIGSTFSALPPGSQQVSLGNQPCYYHGGLYYQPAFVNGNWQYTVIVPPVGTTFFELPAGWSTRTVAGVNYYTFDGVYYLSAFVNGQVGYVVVQAPTKIE
jgi:hypothetical protein